MNFKIKCLFLKKKNKKPKNKKTATIFIDFVFYLETNLGRIDILIILILPTYKHYIYFHLFRSPLVSMFWIPVGSFRSLEFFLCASLSSLVFCLETSVHGSLWKIISVPFTSACPPASTWVFLLPL